MRRLLRLVLASTLLSSAAGCGGAMHRASSGARFELDNVREIDDEDVAKAFAAAPQVPDKPRVAFYAFDDAKAADIERALASIPNVSGVYRIPPLLVTGKRRFDDASPYGQSQEISVKKLRLLAARAHADVLVVIDNGWRGGGVNGLVALNFLVVPIFVTPWLSSETESYAQAYVVDVRNGYLYGDATAEAKDGKGSVTIWGDGPHDLAEQRWPKLLAAVREDVADKLEKNRVKPAAQQAAVTP